MKNVLFAVTLIASAVAFADNSELFVQLDVDQNGAVSQEEAQINPALSKDFAVLDVNADGALTADEFKQYAAL